MEHFLVNVHKHTQTRPKTQDQVTGREVGRQSWCDRNSVVYVSFGVPCHKEVGIRGKSSSKINKEPDTNKYFINLIHIDKIL